MRHLSLYIVILSILLSVGQTVMAQLSVPYWPIENGLNRSPHYEVSVRLLSSDEWTSVPVLRCDVNTRRVAKAAFAEFDMGSAPVVVKVKIIEPATNSVPVIRPASRLVKAERTGESTFEFTLKKPEFLSVEFDGDRQHNLHIFANALQTEVHTPDEPGVLDWTGAFSQDVFFRNPRIIYFGPGIHKPKDLPSEEIKIPSNCTIYIAPGAVVKARLIVDHAENVRIIGRGVIDHALRGVEITYSRNVTVDGLTFLNPAHYTIFGGQSENIVVRNIKTFSARSWTDGIDLMCCRNVEVENCFLRTSDDCIALYNHRWWYWGGSENIRVSRCTFWPDVAHPVNIGSHGDDRSTEGETLCNVRISDCDILFNDGEGLLAINCGDQNHVRDIHFDSIRVEGIKSGRLFDLRVLYSEKYNRKPGCCIDSVTFSHITVDDESAAILRPSRINDYDEKRGVGHVDYRKIWVGHQKFNPSKDIERVMGNP